VASITISTTEKPALFANVRHARVATRSDSQHALAGGVRG